MILVDLNQILIASVMSQLATQKNVVIEEDLIRHFALNALRTHLKNFKQYGEVILCCDNKNYWRKQVFSYYKASRKKSREKSELDWSLIFGVLDKIRQELKDYFPYKVIDVQNAEADDIIGTLAPRHVKHENVLILSSDGDFHQLQRYNANNQYKIKQYNPALKKYIVSENPLEELKEKIIRGDKGDGIPNVLSPSNSFVDDIRQKSITKGILEKMMMEDVSSWEKEIADGFRRNELLIDLKNIPDEIKEKIINTYDEVKPAPRSKLLTYFIEKKLKNLMDVIEEF